MPPTFGSVRLIPRAEHLFKSGSGYSCVQITETMTKRRRQKEVKLKISVVGARKNQDERSEERPASEADRSRFEETLISLQFRMRWTW